MTPEQEKRLAEIRDFVAKNHYHPRAGVTWLLERLDEVNGEIDKVRFFMGQLKARVAELEKMATLNFDPENRLIEERDSLQSKLDVAVGALTIIVEGLSEKGPRVIANNAKAEIAKIERKK